MSSSAILYPPPGEAKPFQQTPPELDVRQGAYGGDEKVYPNLLPKGIEGHFVGVHPHAAASEDGYAANHAEQGINPGIGHAGPALVLDGGFGNLQVPDMPSYVQSYSKRGNTFDGQTTPVYQQARWGNRTGRGGMAAYLSQLETPQYFDALKQKLGDAGVYEALRWSPGYDWRGGFGVASLAANKNYVMTTRGGQLRKGGPKRSDYVDRPNAWFEKTMPGIAYGRYTQNNDNYSGVYEWKRNTPFVERDTDMLVLREMIEHNPYHINSHAAAAAKAAYDAEFGNVRDRGVPAYNDNLPASKNKAAIPNQRIYDHDPRLPQHETAVDPGLVYKQYYEGP